MYKVTIRGHVMIAHSLPSETFGPAQNLHGATYVVDASFSEKQLDKDNIVIDIDLATRMLTEVLKPINYQNLDEMKEFDGLLTTTEFLARWIHDQMRQKLPDFKGGLKINLGESHIAWASYESKGR